MFYDHLTEFDRLLDSAFSARFRAPVTCTEVSTPQNPFRPRMDLFEAKDLNTVTATFELPGLKSEDVAIDIQQNRLTISGEAAGSNTQEDGGHSAVRERRLGKFSRILQLPIGTKAEDIEAKMENGLLTISFPKVSPEQQPHRIPISTA